MIFTPFRIFDLPAELRNLVFKNVAVCHTLWLRKRRFEDHSGLLSVGPQLRQEYLPIVMLCAPKIWVKVVNFDLRNVVTFLNHLSAATIHNLSTITAAKERQLRIRIYVNDASHNSYLIWRWLNRMNHVNKEGTNLDIRYYLRKYVLGRTRPALEYPLLRDWARRIDRFLERGRDGRARDEALKIRALFSGRA
jgi:hypothetical protein